MKQSIKVLSLKTAFKVNENYYLDAFRGLIVEGVQRLGKTSFVSQVLAEAFGEWSYDTIDGRIHATCVKPNYREVKKWIVFPPKDFLNLVLELPTGLKEKGVIWDDAGFWIFALDWYDPFVKSVAKYIQLCGRQFGMVFFTTPSKKLISGKVLEAMPEFYVGRVIKRGRDTYTYRPRLCKVYERWDYPDGKKGGVKTRWQDKYNAMLLKPKEAAEYYKWYKPISDHYLDIGKKILKREYDKMMHKLSKREKEDSMESVHKAVGDPDNLKEIEEVLRMYEPPKPKH